MRPLISGVTGARRRCWSAAALFLVASAFPLGARAQRDSFDEYLKVPFPPADGFEHPLSRSGAESRDVGAPAAGRVALARPARRHAGAEVWIEHVYYEHNQKRRVWSRVRGLDALAVRTGAIVARGQRLGTVSPGDRSPIGFELALARDGQPIDAAAFLAGHAHLFDPHQEEELVLIDRARYRMRLYEAGKRVGEYEVGFGQARGCKEREGDLRSPCGMYFVTDKSEGPFAGEYAAYFGGHWIKMNYPSAADADRGVAAGLISPADRGRIAAAWAQRQLTPQNTPLGSGIGFHGWAHEWDGKGGAHLSWGCVVLHLRDVADVFARLERGAMVVIW